MNKRWKISIILLSLALLCATGSVFAYFVFRSDSLTGSTETAMPGASEWIQKISNTAELERYGADPAFNSADSASAISSRKILKFAKNIALTSDIEITNDVHLDLGAYNLDLGSNNLTFRNPYVGELRLTSTTGEIVSAGGKIVLELPEGILAETELSQKASDLIVAADYSAPAVFARAHAFARSRINGNYRTGYEQVTGYLCYDLTFRYAENAYFDSNGNLKNGLPATKAEGCALGVPTEISLTIENASGESYPCALPVVVISQDVLENCAALGRQVLDDYFKDYLQGGAYVLKNNIQLPEQNAYYGIEFAYSAADERGADALTPESNGPRWLTRTEGGARVTLNATVKLTEGAGTETPLEPYEFQILDVTNYEIAKRAMESVAEGEAYAAAPFVFTLPTDEKTLRGMESLGALGVESVAYRLLNNTYGSGRHYEFRGNTGSDPDSYTGSGMPVLGVVGKSADNLPDYSKEIYLEATFRFAAGSPREVVLKYRVYYSPSSGEGGEAGPTSYLLQYSEILKLFRERTEGGKTYRTFRMPGEILDTKVRYELAEPLPQGLNLTENENEGIFDFVIDLAALPLENQTVTVVIKFARPNASGIYDWENAFPRSYTFNLWGIIQNGEGGMPDLWLYKGVLGAVNALYASSDGVLLTERARTLTELTLDGTGVPSVTAGYGGMELLTGLERLTLRNANFAAEQYKSDFAKLSALPLVYLDLTGNRITVSESTDDLLLFDGFYTLETLILDGNPIQNLDGFRLLPRLKTLCARNCGMTDADGAVILESLRTLDLSNASDSAPNRIADFSALLKLSRLAELVCFGNAEPEGNGLGDNANEWKFNYVTFALLETSGAEVYNGYTVTDGVREKVRFEAPASGLLREFVWVLSGVYHYENGEGELILPRLLTAESGRVYRLSWDVNNLSGATSSDEGEFVRVTHTAPAGEYRIYASIAAYTESGGTEISVGAAETVSRAFPVTVGGGA